MAHAVLSAHPAGPLIMVGIRPLDAYERKGIGRAISCTGLVDTGASASAIAPDLAKQAGLIQSDVSFVRHAGRSVMVPSYAARVRFQGHDGLAGWQELTLVGSAPATPGVGMLIGRDMLARVTMLYDGPKNSVVLLF